VQLIFRFLLVGIMNTIVGISAIYFLLHVAELSYWFSTFFGNVIGACVSYLLNKTFTFRSNKSVKQTIFHFFLVISLCYFFAYFIGIRLSYWLIQKGSNLPLTYVEEIAILLGTAIYTVLNFIGQKRIVFAK
jgi:putative flippase GtrA